MSSDLINSSCKSSQGIKHVYTITSTGLGISNWNETLAHTAVAWHRNYDNAVARNNNIPNKENSKE